MAFSNSRKEKQSINKKQSNVSISQVENPTYLVILRSVVTAEAQFYGMTLLKHCPLGSE